MPLKTKSVIFREVVDSATAAVEAVFQGGKLIDANAVAEELLDASPDCMISLDELVGLITRLAADKGTAVRFGMDRLAEFPG